MQGPFSHTTASHPSAAAPGAMPTASPSRALWIGLGAVVLTVAGVASALAWRGSASEMPGAPTGQVAAATSPSNTAPAVIDEREEPAARQPAPASTEAPVVPEVVRKPVQRRAPAEAPATAQAPVCATCGVVESVQAVKQPGQATGIGAVAGGVLGGVVGNQIGGGNGRKAMTVLGAIGGGVAGHEIEKSTRSTTVYSVRVRMDDGTTRTVQQSTAPAVGSRVQIDGTTLRAG